MLAKLVTIELSRGFHQRGQTFGLFFVSLVLGFSLWVVDRKLDAGLLGQVARDFRKRLALDMHQEGEHVARSLAPEAVVEASVGMHIK